MNKSYYSLGLMSGTSMDGIDASIIKSDGKTKDGMQRFTPMLNYLTLSQEISEGIERGPAFEYCDTTLGMEKKDFRQFFFNF